MVFKFFERKSKTRKAATRNLTVDEVDKVAVHVMRYRRDEMGEADSGTFGTFARRVEREQMITRFERELAELVSREEPKAQVMDLNSGIGPASLALAVHGIHSTVVEMDRRRVAAAEMIRREIAHHDPVTGENYNVMLGTFPNSQPDAMRGKRRVAVLTNMIGSHAAAHESEIIRALADFDAVYVDLQRFCTSRTEESEFRDLRVLMAAAGLTDQELVMDHGPSGHYYRLRKE